MGFTLSGWRFGWGIGKFLLDCSMHPLPTTQLGFSTAEDQRAR